MLETVADEQLRVYVVWEPMLPGDSKQVAGKATELVPDPRVTHFWIGSREVAKAFMKPLGLKNTPAWDVYLAYPAKTAWGDDIPAPAFFMHQLREPPKDRFLDGDDLAKELRALIDSEIE